MSETKIKTAECRFCGQVVQIREGEYTQEEAQEMASMTCSCVRATTYQKMTRRRERALNNIQMLFKNESEEILSLLQAAVDIILDDKMEKITLNLYNGVRAGISKNSKGEINVERTVTRKQKLSE